MTSLAAAAMEKTASRLHSSQTDLPMARLHVGEVEDDLMVLSVMLYPRLSFFTQEIPGPLFYIHTNSSASFILTTPLHPIF